MINLRKFDIEYTIATLFGLLGFVLSFIIGLLAGNDVGVVMARAILFAFVFSIISYISMFTVKKYIPEIYEIINSKKSSEQNEDLAISPEEVMDSSVSLEEGADTSIPPEESAPIPKQTKKDVSEEELTTIDTSDMKISDSHLDISQETRGIDGQVTVSKGKKNIKYEPKLMAKAVRSMMKRDER